MKFQVSGYDKQTDRLAVVHVVPVELVTKAKALARVKRTDDGLGCYPLERTDAIILAFMMGFDPDPFNWVLEPATVQE